MCDRPIENKKAYLIQIPIVAKLRDLFLQQTFQIVIDILFRIVYLIVAHTDRRPLEPVMTGDGHTRALERFKRRSFLIHFYYAKLLYEHM